MRPREEIEHAPLLLLPRFVVRKISSEREGAGERETRNYRAGSSRDNTRHRINVGAAGNSHLIITGRMLTHRIRWSDLITAPSDRVSANKRSRVSREVASARANNIFINDLSRVIELVGEGGGQRRRMHAFPFSRLLSYLILSRLELSRADGKRREEKRKISDAETRDTNSRLLLVLSITDFFLSPRVYSLFIFVSRFYSVPSSFLLLISLADGGSWSSEPTTLLLASFRVELFCFEG